MWILLPMKSNKWPKTFSPLTAEQEIIRDDFMKYWHEILASRAIFNTIENFNHQYATQHFPHDFLTTLEVGAGLGEHLNYENLSTEQRKNYVALEMREQMAAEIKLAFPDVKTVVGDCQKRLAFPDGYFDRIIAIHVLEHLPNLPAAIKEMYRLCNKTKGYFSVVIPCEGGLAYSFARKISAKRIFERRYKQSYQWFIEREHVNIPAEIIEELKIYFDIQHQRFFPMIVPFVNCNLCIGMTLRPKNSGR